MQIVSTPQQDMSGTQVHWSIFSNSLFSLMFSTNMVFTGITVLSTILGTITILNGLIASLSMYLTSVVFTVFSYQFAFIFYTVLFTIALLISQVTKHV